MNATRWMATLSLGTLLLAGCGSDPGTRTNGEWLVLSPSGEPVTTTVDLDQLQYNSIEGQLAAGSGGVMVESVPDWGKNVTFGSAVPPEAMDPAWGDVSFVIEVPTTEMYLLYPDLYNVLVIRLSPDGMHFLAPLTVFATWMPWEGAPPEGLIFENDGEYVVLFRRGKAPPRNMGTPANLSEAYKLAFGRSGGKRGQRRNE